MIRNLLSPARHFGLGLMACAMLLLAPGCQGQTGGKSQPSAKPKTKMENPDKITKSKAEWRKELSPEAYEVLFEHGTERAYSGEYVDNHKKGAYLCAACKQPVFSSETKFESGTGWPSFYQPIAAGMVAEDRDASYGMVRREVHCSRCGGHLGHVFEDGPKPTGERFCINSVSLTFKEEGK